MKKLSFVNIKSLTSFLISVFTFKLVADYNVSYALTCGSYGSGSSFSGGVAVPDPAQILCPIVRLVSIVGILGGIVLVAMIAFGALKMAVSLGDPKGLEGASRTWTYAVIGFFIVIGAAAIMRLISTMFGIEIINPANVIGGAEAALNQFLEELLIFTD